MFAFPLDPKALFAERARQFAGWGIPWRIIHRVQSRVHDCWLEGPGGWTHEWWQEAELAQRQGKHMRAAMLYGAARFPVLATPMRERALRRQVESFELAVRRLPGHFERRLLRLTSAGGSTVAVHLYAPTSSGRQALVLLSGGVDTGKMELHRLALFLAMVGRFRVAAMDMPGTGESQMALSADAHRTYQELLATLAPTGPKALVGVSFAGHWAAKLALMGAVDAAVDWGGPTLVFDSDGAFASKLPNGMLGIIANACGLPCLPSEREVKALMQGFSWRSQGLLEGDRCAPMLVVNGEHDPYIPQHDSTVFASYPTNDVWLMQGMTHCAAEGVLRTIPAMAAWLNLRLCGETIKARLALALAQQLLPARLRLPRPN